MDPMTKRELPREPGAKEEADQIGVLLEGFVSRVEREPVPVWE